LFHFQFGEGVSEQSTNSQRRGIFRLVAMDLSRQKMRLFEDYLSTTEETEYKVETAVGSPVFA
jgi:hypothetical protein